MTMRLARAQIPWPLFRMAAALALAAGSFAALRELYHGANIFPTYDEHWPLFFVLPAVFGVCAVWCGAEVGRALISVGRVHSLSWPAATALSLGAYLAVAAVVWVLDPTPQLANGTFPYRAYMSLFWSVGLLMETGNFSEIACCQ